MMIPPNVTANGATTVVVRLNHARRVFCSSIQPIERKYVAARRTSGTGAAESQSGTPSAYNEVCKIIQKPVIIIPTKPAVTAREKIIEKNWPIP